MKHHWEAYSVTAQHKLFGAIAITHRSQLGHFRGTLRSTGQQIEVCVENIELPKPQSKVSVRKEPTKKQQLAALIEELFS